MKTLSSIWLQRVLNPPNPFGRWTVSFLTQCIPELSLFDHRIVIIIKSGRLVLLIGIAKEERIWENIAIRIVLMRITLVSTQREESYSNLTVFVRLNQIRNGNEYFWIAEYPEGPQDVKR